MDMISKLPEDLLLRILSELPTAKDVVATMVLSKRWQPLWKSVPKLVFDDDDDRYQNIDTIRNFAFRTYSNF
ncbi:BnaC02g12300D [Brassica napus]|uniref:BnaC02g12300D protein n=1 Tax=Brassica napus TaxID=3708 RepID=A0A078HWQ5_BRANA|nr:BnaC02g12300D [Brassica napus]